MLNPGRSGAVRLRPPDAPVQGAAFSPPCSALDAPVRGFLISFPIRPNPRSCVPASTLESLQPWRVSLAAFVLLVLPSCSFRDDPVPGYSPSSPRCFSPWGRLLAALHCPARTSPWRRSAVPWVFQPWRPPTCRSAPSRMLLSGASCVLSPYAPILGLGFLHPLWNHSICSIPAACLRLILGLVRCWLLPLCLVPDDPVRSCPSSCPGRSSPGGRPLVSSLCPGCSSPGAPVHVSWMFPCRGPPSCRLTLAGMLQPVCTVARAAPCCQIQIKR